MADKFIEKYYTEKENRVLLKPELLGIDYFPKHSFIMADLVCVNLCYRLTNLCYRLTQK